MSDGERYLPAMSPAPWDADRPLDARIASAAIRECFPAVATDAISHIGAGWEFDAYATTDGWVFRFPRRAEAAALFAAERPVHALLAGALPSQVRIPRVELIGRPTSHFPYAIAGHRFIDGVPTDAIDQSLLPRLAHDLAVALAAIHAIPERDARAAGIAGPDPDDPGRAAWLDGGVRRAAALVGIDPVIDRAVRWVQTADLLPPVAERAPVLIHQDLSPEHVLADPTTGALTGIIDWTDATLGDPARDFVFLVTAHGWDFTDDVLGQYPPVDDGFRERLGFMARLLAVIWLAEARERDMDIAKHVRWVRNAFAEWPGDD